MVPDLPMTTGWWVAALLLAAWLLTLVLRALRRAWWLRNHRRRVRRARRGELDAQDVLWEAGFEIIDSQVHGGWTVEVDGEPREITLFADHLVERDGRRYVAEVKTGQLAPHIETASTRRQLLEYLFAFEVDGLLLVDMEEGEVRQVVFPIAERLHE